MTPRFLTIWTCATSLYWEVEVQGSEGARYVVHWGRLPEARIMETGESHGWQCECRGYRFRGTCRHVREVEATDARCAWNADLDPSAEPAKGADGNLRCPDCGGPVRARRVPA